MIALPASLIVFAAKDLFVGAPLIAFAWFLRAKRQPRADLVRFAVVSLPLSFFVLKAAGKVWYDARPFVVGHFTPLIAHAADNGFPSDHAMLCAAFAALLWPFDRRWSAAAWLVAVLVGSARVAVGVHHAADIAGSFLLAALTAWAVWRWIVPPLGRADWYRRLSAKIGF